MTFTVEYRQVMCERCHANDARRRLYVDPGPDQPVTVIGNFCISCVQHERGDYESGRKNWPATA